MKPGDDWERLAERVEPGDEIILWPGRHEPATFERLHGAPGAPITIRGLAPDRPSVIAGAAWGLRIEDARHLRVRDLVIEDARIHGLEITGGADGAPGRDIEITGVRVRRTGERDDRHAVRLERLSGLRVRGLEIRGFTGSAIEIVGGEAIEITDVDVHGEDGFAGRFAVRVGGGATGVDLRDVRVHGGAATGLGLGLPERPRSRPEPDAVPAYETTRVLVQEVLLTGAALPFMVGSVDVGRIERCTIAHAEGLLFRFVEVPGASPLRNLTVGACLFAWAPDALDRHFDVAGEVALDGLYLDQNLWWTDADDAVRERLGPFPGTEAFPQVTDVDPDLDGDGIPRTPEAGGYGHAAGREAASGTP